MAWLVMNLCPESLNVERAMKLALVHDLPEVFVGDITPHDGISKADKVSMETQAAEKLFTVRPDLMELWREYVDGETPEARFVKECDALDMALQAVHYQRKHGTNTSEFIASAKAKINSPALLALFDKHC